MLSSFDGRTAKRQRTDSGREERERVIMNEDVLRDSRNLFRRERYQKELLKDRDLFNPYRSRSPLRSPNDIIDDLETTYGSEPAYYNNSGSFSRPMGGGNSSNRPTQNNDDIKPNHILLITIMNPAYPITVDVINTICSPSGKVLRIVIFKKNGVQAMVEFDTVESAVCAKDSLNGADIYSGCCTLKIEFAKPTRLNVYKNDTESWDYTNPTLSGSKGDRPPLLGEPRGYGSGNRYRDEGYSRMSDDSFSDVYGDSAYGERYGERYEGRHGDQGNYSMGPSSEGSSSMGQGSVMMVYGLNPEKINCDRLFNLFCLYGNVYRIKFLKSKEGCAMVQMGDPLAVERCVSNLNNAFMFNSKMQLGYSKQAFLNDVLQPYELPDNTLSFRDYMGNRNNRFTNPEAACKNRIQPPSKILHFFNTPPNITEDELKNVFIEQECTPPSSVKLFPSKSEKSSSGLLLFDEAPAALDALVLCNHLSILNPGGKNPYLLKLCFSSTRQQF